MVQVENNYCMPVRLADLHMATVHVHGEAHIDRRMFGAGVRFAGKPGRQVCHRLLVQRGFKLGADLPHDYWKLLTLVPLNLWHPLNHKCVEGAEQLA